jgi:hypothetical protein
MFKGRRYQCQYEPLSRTRCAFGRGVRKSLEKRQERARQDASQHLVEGGSEEEMAGYLNNDGSGLVGGLSPSNVGQALKLDAGGNLLIASGEAGTPVVTGDQIRSWILNGQGFTGTTGKQTAAGQITGGFGLFNPAASGKTLLVYALRYTIGNNSFNQLNLVTSDPAFGSAASVTNNRASSPIGSVASVTYANSNQVPGGTTHDFVGSATNTLSLVLEPNEVVVLPPGNGLAFYANISGANVWVVSASWIEM